MPNHDMPRPPARDSQHDRDSGPGWLGCLVWLLLLTAVVVAVGAMALLASGSR